jgi:hypothetical protein
MTDVDTSEAAASPASRPPPRRRRTGRLVGFVVVLAAILGGTIAVWASSDGGDEPDAAAEVLDPEPAPSTAPPTTAAPATTLPPTTAAAPVPPLRTPTPEAPLSVWFSGDSTAFTIGNALRNQNGEGLLSLELRLKTSSGLSRPDFFDWNVFLGAVQDLNPPEVMVLSMGANDAQGVQASDGTWHVDVHSEGWRAEYLRRVDELSRRVIDKGTRLYWVGQPVARDPSYTAFVGLIDDIYQEIDARYDEVVYLDTYTLLADENLNYTDYKPGPDGQPWLVRQPDGIHLESWGGELVAAELLAALRRDWSA